MVIEEDMEGYTTFQLEVIVNPELARDLLAYGLRNHSPVTAVTRGVHQETPQSIPESVKKLIIQTIPIICDCKDLIFFNIANKYSATFRKIIPQLSSVLFRNYSLLHWRFSFRELSIVFRQLLNLFERCYFYCSVKKSHGIKFSCETAVSEIAVSQVQI